MAAPSWREVSANPQFQALDQDQQEAARQQYFRDVVAPRVSTDELDSAYQAFLQDTAPPSTTDRLVDSAKQVIGNMADPFGSSEPAKVQLNQPTEHANPMARPRVAPLRREAEMMLRASYQKLPTAKLVQIAGAGGFRAATARDVLSQRQDYEGQLPTGENIGSGPTLAAAQVGRSFNQEPPEEHSRLGSNLKISWNNLLNSFDGAKANEYGALLTAFEREYSPEQIAADPKLAEEYELRKKGLQDALAAVQERGQENRGLMKNANEATQRFLSAGDQEGLLNQAKELGAAFVSDPVGVIADLGIQSSLQSLATVAAAVAARYGGATPGGAAAVGGAGSGFAEFGNRYAAKRLDGQSHEEATSAAAIEAGIVGAFDAASFLSAGRSLDKVMDATAGQRLVGAVKETAKEANKQGILGAGGEAVGGLASGEGSSIADIAAEYVGEFATGPMEAVATYGEKSAGRQLADALQSTVDNSEFDQQGIDRAARVLLNPNADANTELAPEQTRPFAQPKGAAAPAEPQAAGDDIPPMANPIAEEEAALAQSGSPVAGEEPAVSEHSAEGLNFLLNTHPDQAVRDLAKRELDRRGGGENAAETRIRLVTGDDAAAVVSAAALPASEDSERDPSLVTREEAAVATAILGVGGHQPIFFASTSDSAPEGIVFTGQDPKSVYINARAGATSVYATAGHEVSHHIQATAPDQWATFVAAVGRAANIDISTDGGILAYAPSYWPGSSSLITEAQQAGSSDKEIVDQLLAKFGNGYTRAEIADEFHSDLFGNRFREKGFYQAVIRELARTDVGLLQKMGAVLKQIIDAVRASGRVRGFNVDKFVNDMEAVRQEAARVYAAYASRKDTASRIKKMTPAELLLLKKTTRDEVVRDLADYELKGRETEAAYAQREAKKEAELDVVREDARDTKVAQAVAETKAAGVDSGQTAMGAAFEKALKPRKSELRSQVDKDAHEAATSPLNRKPEPTEAQKKAGVYAMGHTRVAGMDISIENPAGSTRSGVDPNGKAWSIDMKSHYGYIRGTIGKDKDHIDVFLRPGIADDYAGPVFVIDQVSPSTGRFDEHKVMLGWASSDGAGVAYRSNYTKGWKGQGAVTKFTLPEFKTWLESGETKSPAARYSPRRPEFKNQTLPTRWPTSKALNPQPTVDDNLITDLATLKLNDKQYAKAVDAILAEPGMHSPGMANGTTDEKAEHVLQRMEANLLWLYDQVPAAIRERSKLWYDGARAIAENWAEKYNLSESQAAGALAVLSPQKDWFMNVTLAERVMDILHTQQDHKFDDKMTAAAFAFLAKDAGEGRNTAAFEAIKSKTLAQVIAHGDLRQMGIWVRAYDEAYHDPRHAIVTPEGGFVEDKTTKSGDPTMRAWGDFTTAGKAASIYVDGTPENINKQLGAEHKVRNFYNNIYAPKDSRFTTIDTHAVAADLLRPLAGASKAVADNFGKTGGTNTSGLAGTYALHYEAYRRAAEARGVLPREMQSITWEAVRGLFTEGYKGKEANVKAIDAIWKKVDAGKLDIDSARAQVLEHAGGIEHPDWWQEGNAEYEAVLRDKTYLRERRPFHGAKILFEVAPNPKFTDLKARWDKLTPKRKHTISDQVAWKIAAKAIASLGDDNMKGELHHQLGGWMADTNPSMAIWFGPRAPGNKVDLAARIIGAALRQESMMRSSPRPFRGSDGKPVPASGAVMITRKPGDSAEKIYAAARTVVDQKGRPVVEGHTTDDRTMVIVYSDANAKRAGMRVEDLARDIDDALGGAYDVRTSNIHVEFIDDGKGGNYALPRKGSDSARTSARATADQLRAEADALFEQLVGGARKSARRSNVRSGGAAGAGLAPLAVGTKPGQVTGQGIHFSRQFRETLSSKAFGTGIKGAELDRLSTAEDKRLLHRIYFYVNTGKGITPEPGVGAFSHQATLSNVYDATADSADLKVGRAANAFESAVLDAGFDGYVDTNLGIAVLLGERELPVAQISQGGRPIVPEFQRGPLSVYGRMMQAVSSSRALPAGEMTGADWKNLVPKLMPELDVSHLEDGKSYYRSQIVKRPEVRLSPDRRLAPNGLPSKLTEKQWAEVRTPEFKAWFGDWEKHATGDNPEGSLWSDNDVSKVVDPVTREPMVVYHGTDRAGFAVFDPRKNHRKQRGTFFSSNQAIASTYAHRYAPRVELNNNVPEDGRPGVYAAYLNLRRPTEDHFEGANWDGSFLNDEREIFSDEDSEWLYSKDGKRAMSPEEAEAVLASAPNDTYEIRQADALFRTTNSVVAEAALDSSSDGAYIHEVVDNGPRGEVWQPSDVFVIFNANQVKSADENQGTFSTEEDDIRLSPSRQSLPQLAETARGRFTWNEQSTNEVGPVFSGRGVSLEAFARVELEPGPDNTAQDFPSNGEIFPLGHGRAVRNIDRVYWMHIRNNVAGAWNRGQVYGKALIEINDFGEIDTIHDIVVDDAFRGRHIGQLVVAQIAANTYDDVRLIDILDQAESFWASMGSGDPNDNQFRDSTLTWTDLVGAVLRRPQSDVRQGGQAGAGAPQEAPGAVRGVHAQEFAAGFEGLGQPRLSPRRRFFSQLARAVESARLETQPAAQWKLWLTSNKSKLGVKDDEIQWTGVNEWLDLQGKAKVAKADLLAYLDNNGVQITETQLTGRLDEANLTIPDGAPLEVRPFDPEYHPALAIGRFQFVVVDTESDTVKGYGNTEKEALGDTYAGYPEYWGKQTKYHAYQLPGGKNYKELLLTLPGKRVQNVRRLTQAEIDANSSLRAEGAKAGDWWGVVDDNGKLVNGAWRTRAAAADALDNLRDVAPSSRTYEGKEPVRFKSTHWDQPNILAHIRFNERTDADGKRVLFIEELQSDWGQEGKKKGFDTGPELRPGWRVVEQEPGFYHLYAGDAKMPRGFGSLDAVMRTAEQFGAIADRKTPTAPFVTDTKAWAGLALKRMIAYAAENGFDRVALVTGEQSAERYDLSKQVDSVDVAPGSNGTYDLEIELASGGTQRKRGLASDELEGFVGKELAAKLVKAADDWRAANAKYREALKTENIPVETLDTLAAARDAVQTEFSGLDLKVGGEGMKAFYDQIVPQVASGILKKLGGKMAAFQVQTATVAKIGRNWGLLNEANNDIDQRTRDPHLAMKRARTVQPGFEITPAMRAAVMRDGLPLFSARRQAETPEFKRWSKGNKLVTLEDSQAVFFRAGEPVVVEALHGTTGDFAVFDRRKANIESDLGAGFYSSNTPEDVGENYAGFGPDLTNKIERETERLANQMQDEPESINMEYEEIWAEARVRAERKFASHEGATMPIWVRFDNPVILGGKFETQLSYDANFNEELDEYGEPTGDVVRLADAIQDLANSGEFEMSEEASGALLLAARENEGLSATEAISIIKETLVYAVDYETGDSATSEIVRRAFEAIGFDGFIDQTVDKKFGSQKRTGKAMAGMNDQTVHFIAFSPSQIKSAIGNSGAFDPDNEDIRFSPRRQTETPEFKRWFAGSKVVDENGKPLRVYHGTQFDFSEFGGYEVAGWFSTDPRHVDSYVENKDSEDVPAPNVMPVYLSINNPLVLGFDMNDGAESARAVAEELGVDTANLDFDGNAWQVVNQSSFFDAAYRAGYDGVKVKESGVWTYGVDRKTQIKSALGNNGAFDPANADIRFSPLRAVKQSIAKLDAAIDGLSNLPDQFEYLRDRYRTLGKIGHVDELVREIKAVFDGKPQADKQAVYHYLTTKGANANIIGPTDLRAAAQRLKRTINHVGDQLVARGLLDPVAREEYRDSYLPRLYLKHLLSDQEWRMIGAGKKPSEMGYLKHRKDIPQEVRELVLGEIKDPAFLSSQAIGRAMRDIALLDWLAKISTNANWVFPGVMVNFNGKQVSAYWLKAEADRIDAQKGHYTAANQTRASQLTASMRAAATAALANLDVDHTLYSQIPDTKRYGLLRGLYVRKEIYNDIRGLNSVVNHDPTWFEQFFGIGHIGTRLTQYWKFSKVAANPPGQVRNFVSNMVMLNLSGIGLHMMPVRLIQAVKEISSNGPHWQVAKKFGVTESTFTAQELYRVKEDMLALQASVNRMNPLTWLKLAGAHLMNGLSDLYQFSEALGKTMKIIDEMSRGKSEAEAAIEAQKWLFDYSLVPQWVRVARSSPVGMPFVTYQIKVLPRLLEVAATAPWRFLPYMALLYGSQMYVASLFGADDDDMDKLKKSLPEWLQDRGHVMFLPWKDADGRLQVADVGYFFPWTYYTQAGKHALDGDFGKVIKNDIGGMFSAPVIGTAAALMANYDNFSKRPIYNEADPASYQAAAIANYLWDFAAPPFISSHGVVSPMGVLGKEYGGKLTQAITGTTNKFGDPRATTVQALAAGLGFNFYGLDPDHTRASNLQRMMRAVTDAEARLKMKLMDRGLTADQRAKAMADYRERMLELAEDAKKYREESEVPEQLKVNRR